MIYLGCLGGGGGRNKGRHRGVFFFFFFVFLGVIVMGNNSRLVQVQDISSPVSCELVCFPAVGLCSYIDGLLLCLRLNYISIASINTPTLNYCTYSI